MLPKKYYHIYNHGNGDDNLFRKETNYLHFLKKYSHYVTPIADTYAWCLMPNHFHFLIKIKKEEELISYFQSIEKGQEIKALISRQFSNFFNSYSKAYNKMFDRQGKLFLLALKKKEITNKQYFCKVVHYIHANPVHHGFTSKMEDWKFSSYQSLISDNPSKIKRENAFEIFNGKEEFEKYHKQRIDNNLMLDMDF